MLLIVSPPIHRALGVSQGALPTLGRSGGALPHPRVGNAVHGRDRGPFAWTLSQSLSTTLAGGGALHGHRLRASSIGRSCTSATGCSPLRRSTRPWRRGFRASTSRGPRPAPNDIGESRAVTLAQVPCDPGPRHVRRDTARMLAAVDYLPSGVDLRPPSGYPRRAARSRDWKGGRLPSHLPGHQAVDRKGRWLDL